MNFRPTPEYFMVRDLIMTITSRTNRAGMPTSLNFSMPPPTPLRLMKKQMSMNSSVTPMPKPGVVSSAPNTSLPGVPLNRPITFTMM